MRLSMGAFRELHNGYGIYWSDCRFNVDGGGDYATIGEARAAIDRLIEAHAQREAAEKAAKIAAGAVHAVRSGDAVTVHLAGGPVELSIREYRRRVFDLEAEHGDIVLTRG